LNKKLLQQKTVTFTKQGNDNLENGMYYDYDDDDDDDDGGYY
jgi:hypothetical protein